jgi:hypothetical protein
LLVVQFPAVVHATATPSSGVSISTSSDVELSSLSLNGLVQINNSLIMTLTSGFSVIGGGQPDIKVSFNGGASTPTSQNAQASVGMILYYVGAGKNFVPVSSSNISVDVTNSTNTLMYNIDLSGEAENVLNYFSATVNNLTLDDVGFEGTLYIQVTFSNAIGNLSYNGFLSFPITLQGNFTSVSIDFTIPEEYDLADYTLSGTDMIKIFPNRAQENLEITPMESSVSDLYLEWEIPATPSPTPFYNSPPWDWIIYGLIGVCLTLLVEIGRSRFKKYRLERKEKNKKEIR